MAQTELGTLGTRIRAYRRLNSMTAADLAAMAGAGLTRSVIANIESGRRADVTLHQLFAISRALGVPPVTLMFDVGEDSSTVDIEGVPESIALSVARAVEWLTGDPLEGPGERTRAGDHATRIVTASRALQRARNRLGMAESRRNTASPHDDVLTTEIEIDQLSKEVAEFESLLKSLNAELKND